MEQAGTKRHKWGPNQEKAFGLFCQGMTITAIAKEVGITRSKVSLWQNWPTWQRKWKEYQEEQASWRTRIREPIAQRAVQELTAMLDSDVEPEVRVKAATQLGKWGGLDQPRQVQISGNLATMTDDELAARRAALTATATPPSEPSPDDE